MKRTGSIPVVMYHSVGRKILDWKWDFLTVPYLIFEDHLKWLKKSNYITVDLNQLYDHVTGNEVLKSKSVVLTFDDGYLDNWTYVAPLLKHYLTDARTSLTQKCQDIADFKGHLCQDIADPIFIYIIRDTLI